VPLEVGGSQPAPGAPRAPARFGLVIFDNDGVLVDSEWHANEVLAELLTEYGLPCTRERCVEEFMGSSLATVRQRVETARGCRLPQDFEERYHARLFAMFRAGLRPVPGVAEMLDRVAIPVCVASSGTHARIRLALATTGLLDRFAGRIFSAEDVTRGKPAPDLFLHAAQALGVRPAGCAVIEDTPVGIDAAHAAGMTAFGFARMTPRARLAHASGGVFDAMTELPDLLAGAS
jgi:HAD superfamily hydrolase (TIGR01509 family)